MVETHFKENETNIKKIHKVTELKSGTNIVDVFVVKFKKPVQKYKNGYMFELRIGDSSGEVMLKFWGDNNQTSVGELYNSIKKDDVILVSGMVGEYLGNIEISVNKENTIKVCQKGTYNITDFLPITEKDIDGMLTKLQKIIETINEPTLKKIILYFFNDKEVIQNIKDSPAAMYKHHGWIGGLLEHILDMIEISESVLKVHPELNRSLLITGIILHDIGKIEELEVTTSIKTSKVGHLKGHTIIMIEQLTKALIDLEISKNEEIVLKLTHMILSHHGKLEYGSSKLPAFPEAMALYQIDELNAKLKNMITSMNNANTEDDYIYSKDFGNIYLK